MINHHRHYKAVDIVRRFIFLTVLAMISSACTTGFYDGKRVNDRTSPIPLSGFITSPSSSGAEVRVSAYNVVTNAWNVIATTATSGSISNSVTWTMNDGTELYSWNLGSQVLNNDYWQWGTGGYYARVKAEWFSSAGTRVAKLLNPRYDWLTCFFENYNGEGNTLGYITSNCFTHRPEAYIYTSNYREGSIFCPAPSAALSPRHGHYMLNQIPGCAQNIVYNHMSERINRDLIDDHYDIEHNSAPNAHLKDTVVIGASTWDMGGFFGGHERYINKMERHVMVYDYPWMPKGKIPSWDPNTTVPAVFQSAVASPNGNCNSQSAGCSGWLSSNIANASPGILTPVSVLPANVCANHATTASLHGVVNGWHGSVHFALGNTFTTFDSPAFPLFFVWHNYVEDIWRDWKACGNPGP